MARGISGATCTPYVTVGAIKLVLLKVLLFQLVLFQTRLHVLVDIVHSRTADTTCSNGANSGTCDLLLHRKSDSNHT